MGADNVVWMGAVAGAAGGMAAATVTQPIELLKVRLQLSGERATRAVDAGSAPAQATYPAQRISDRARATANIVRSIAKTDGILSGFYKGLSAALARQVVYSTTRFGVYMQLKDWAGRAFLSGTTTRPGSPVASRLPLTALLPIAMAAGAAGAVISCPTDLVLVRMQSDGRLPPAQRRNYRNVFDGMLRIAREEGVRSLWRGAVPNVNRAMVVAAGQLCTYDACKRWLTATARNDGAASHFFWRPGMKDGLPAHVAASLMSGVVTCVTASPLDVIRTRVMAAKTAGGVSGSPGYKGSFDCFLHILRTEGIRGFYRGFGAYYAKVGPYCLTIFVVYEQVYGALQRVKGGAR